MKKYLNLLKRKAADFSHKSQATINSDQKIISFTFDDVPRSAFNNAGNTLSRNNINGTFYVALSFLTQSDPLFEKADLENCLKQGNEIGCHTFNHFHFYQTNNNKFISDDLKRNQEELNKLNLNTSFQNFSYPFGEQTRKAKKHVSKLFKTSRGIDHGVNIGKVDLNNLKTIKLYENLHSIEKVNDFIDNFDKSGGWLIFYTHDVQDDFSSFGCSPKYFETIVQKCVDKEFEVKTIQQTIEKMNLLKNK